MSAPRPPADIAHGVPPISISSTTTRVNKTGSWKYIRPVYQDKVAPCNEGCPVGIDIEGYMNLLREGQVDAATDLLLRENPLPAVTGRVCYHPCESACNRRFHDDAVGIRMVERMLGDRALERPLPGPEAKRNEKVAVIGSGPAGLGCAFHLVRLGYGVTVFEAAPEPGGILRLGIPDYRLPRSVLAAEVERIRKLGVEFRCGVKVGVDVPWSELSGYDAVFLGTGAHRSRRLGIDGEDGPGLGPGLDLLRRLALGERPDLGDKVVVLGGGNTAMDCARSARRLGAEVTVLYRRTRAEMPAIEEEVDDAEAEGVALTFLAAPVKVRRDGDGRLQGLECLRMQLGTVDDSGRRRPVAIPDSGFFVPADTVLAAIGESIEDDLLPGGITAEGGAVACGEWGGAGSPRFFAGGDLADQPRTVAHALGAGKRAALGIDRELRSAAGESVAGDGAGPLRLGPHGNVSATRYRNDDPVVRNGAVNDVVRFEQLNTDHLPHRPRLRPPRLTCEQATASFAEVLGGLDEATGLAEAARCFNCGVCNRCELCLIFCPDLAISRRADGTGFAIDYDYCKGCGVCNAECPRGAMAMTREGL